MNKRNLQFQTSAMQNNVNSIFDMKPYIRLIEHPAPKVRYRYKVEGRAAPIQGISSCSENKTFPSIELVGCSGPAIARVSIVTKDEPFRVHPHSIVGRNECSNGICEVRVLPGQTVVSFANLGIQCIKRKEVEESISMRELTGVDPFQQGYRHKTQPATIDLNCIRLCFEVFLGELKDNNPLTPIVSEPIFDIKANRELQIIKMSEYECSTDGGTRDIIMLCEKILKDDIWIRFFEERDGEVVWESFGIFQPGHVHKQAAVWFRPPEYRNLDVEVPVNVNVQLVRPSDSAVSDPVHFRYLPRKHHHHPAEDSVELLKPAKKKATNFNNLSPTPAAAACVDPWETPSPQGLNIPLTIKVEPRENSVSPFGGQVTLGQPQPQEETPDQYVDNLVKELWNERPATNTIQPQNWNQPVLVPSDPNTQGFGARGQTTNNLDCFEDYNMDSGLIKQIVTSPELKEIVLDSGELDEQMLSASLSNIVL